MTRRDKMLMACITLAIFGAGWLIFGADLFTFCGMVGPC